MSSDDLPPEFIKNLGAKHIELDSAEGKKAIFLRVVLIVGTMIAIALLSRSTPKVISSQIMNYSEQIS